VAKAVQVAAPVQAEDPQEWLAGVLRQRFQDVLSHRAAALDPSQTDGIHDMRVAIRRLRSMIRDFAEIVEKLRLKPVRRDLARLADALGEVRDADVAIESLQKLREKTAEPEIIRGLESFTARFRERRSNAFEKLKPELSDAVITKLSTRFEKALDSVLGQRTLFAASTLDDARDEIISNRMDDFAKLTDALYDPHGIRRLHRLRIAGKHLRYAAELFSRNEGDEMDNTADTIAKMQSHLGTVHDCDVWIEQFRSGLKAKKQKALNERRSPNLLAHRSAAAASWRVGAGTLARLGRGRTLNRWLCDDRSSDTVPQMAEPRHISMGGITTRWPRPPSVRLFSRTAPKIRDRICMRRACFCKIAMAAV
jgi:CHAD domain-containing protein